MISEQNKQIKAGKMLMYLYIISVIMIFAGLTSAYIVRQAEGNWRYYDLPSIFWVSTTLIVLSSLTMHLAWKSAQKNQLQKLPLLLSITLILGIGFAATQYLGWQKLVSIQVYLVGNPSESFVYILTGMHLAHMLGAFVFLFWMTIRAFQYKITPNNLFGLEMCMNFWHFLDILWVYMFFFLLVVR